MAEDSKIEIKTGPDFWEFLKSTAKEVQDWPDWKVGEHDRSASAGREPERTRGNGVGSCEFR